MTMGKFINVVERGRWLVSPRQAASQQHLHGILGTVRWYQNKPSLIPSANFQSCFASPYLYPVTAAPTVRPCIAPSVPVPAPSHVPLPKHPSPGAFQYCDKAMVK